MAQGSGTLGLPRGDGASLDVLGKVGTLGQCEGPARTHWPLSSLPRLPWLRQRLLPQLYGLLPHLGEHLLAPWGAKHPSCRGVRLGWLLWGQQRQQGQQALGAAETPWQGCQATGLFLAEGIECCGKREGEGAKGGNCTCGPSTCCCLALSHYPPPQGQTGGAASPQGSTGKGCPIEGSWQGHSPAGHGAGLGSVCWELGAPRADLSPCPPHPRSSTRSSRSPAHFQNRRRTSQASSTSPLSALVTTRTATQSSRPPSRTPAHPAFSH